MKLIDKDAVVAGIKRKLEFVENRLKRNNSYTEEGNIAWKRDKALYDSYDQILSFINSLEVKEVDLDKEISFQWPWFCLNDKDRKSFVKVAKHFFELGLKAQKGE